MPKYEDLPYRPCAGLCVINRKGLVFIGRRTDGPEHIDETHVWQMPQGGIDEGEKPYPAALRELYEETSIKSVEKLGEIKDWLTYDIPNKIGSKAWNGKYRGQKQKWYALRFTGKDSEIDIDNPGGGHEPEFVEWRWEPMENLPDLVVPFKRDDLRAGGEGVLQIREVPVRPERAKGTSKRRSQVKRTKRIIAKRDRKGRVPIAWPIRAALLVHRGALQMLIQHLEVIEPRDRLVERRSPGAISLMSCSISAICACSDARSRSSTEVATSASTVRPSGPTSAKPPSTTSLVCSPAGIDRHDAGTQQRDQRRMAGQHAEVAFGAGHIDLIDLAGERDLLRRHEFEVERGHAVIPDAVTPLPPRASCPSRPPLRWCRPCRRPPPADGRTCLRPGP